jgi:hypothetical protein
MRCVRLTAILTHGVAAHFDAVSIVEWNSRSRMPSASVGSPICSGHRCPIHEQLLAGFVLLLQHHILFRVDGTFILESCSNHPGIPFILPRIPHSGVLFLSFPVAGWLHRQAPRSGTKCAPTSEISVAASMQVS